MAKNGRRISAKDVFKDIEDGLSDTALMEKYKLSEKGLKSVLRKLYSSKVRRIGADSVILHSPVDELAEKFQRDAGESSSQSTPPKPLSKQQQRALGTAGWTCPSCGKSIDARLKKCPKCDRLVRRQRTGSSSSQLEHGTGSGGKQNLRLNGTAEGLPAADSLRSPTDWKMILGGLGTIFLFFGTFTPIVIVPIMGGLNCFQVGKVAEGVALGGYAYMMIAAASIVLVVLKRYVWLWLNGLVSFALLGYTFVQYRRTLGALASRMEQVGIGLGSGNGEMIGGAQGHGDLGQFAEQIADQLPSLVRLDWGWLVLIMGSTLLLVSAFLATRDFAAK